MNTFFNLAQYLELQENLFYAIHIISAFLVLLYALKMRHNIAIAPEIIFRQFNSARIAFCISTIAIILIMLFIKMSIIGHQITPIQFLYVGTIIAVILRMTFPLIKREDAKHFRPMAFWIYFTLFLVLLFIHNISMILLKQVIYIP